MKQIMKKTILLLGLLLATSSSLLAQQESMITFYKDHLNLVNPAFVGVNDNASFPIVYQTAMDRY